MDTCTHLLTEQMLAAKRKGSRSKLQPGVLAAAIVVPVFVVGECRVQARTSVGGRQHGTMTVNCTGQKSNGGGG
jgi:hypothetical protein